MPGRMEPIGQFAQIFAGLPTRSSDEVGRGRGERVLSVRCLTGTGISLSEVENHEVAGRGVDQYRVRTGDLVLSSRSTSLKAAVVPGELEGCLINATLLGVRCLPALHPRLLAAWLESQEGRLALEAVSQSGTNQMNITVTGLSRIVMPVPSQETQSQLVSLLQAADEAYLAAVEAAHDRHRLAIHVAADQMKTQE